MRKESAERFLRAAKKEFNRGRNRLLVPLVGLSLLSVCSSNPAELRQLSAGSSHFPPAYTDQLELPQPPLIIPDPESKNFCEPVSEKSDPVYQAIRGTPVPIQEAVAPSLPVEEQLPQANADYVISPSDIIRSKPINQRDFQALLIFVGYESEDLQYKADELISVYEKAFSKVSVQFSNLAFSVAMKVDHSDRLGILSGKDEYDKVMNKVKQVDSVDTGIVIMNTNERFGGCCPPIAAGESNKSYADATHEFAHELGLYDGDRNGQFSADGPAMSSEALFTKTETLQDDVKIALFSTQTDIFYIGGNCNGDPVYTLGDPSKDIMINYVPDNEELIGRLNNGEDIFDPAQTAIMNNNARKTAIRRIIESP